MSAANTTRGASTASIAAWATTETARLSWTTRTCASVSVGEHWVLNPGRCRASSLASSLPRPLACLRLHFRPTDWLCHWASVSPSVEGLSPVPNQPPKGQLLAPSLHPSFQRVPHHPTVSLGPLSPHYIPSSPGRLWPLEKGQGQWKLAGRPEPSEPIPVRLMPGCWAPWPQDPLTRPRLLVSVSGRVQLQPDRLRARPMQRDRLLRVPRGRGGAQVRRLPPHALLAPGLLP